jgi:hypothetical protein
MKSSREQTDRELSPPPYHLPKKKEHKHNEDVEESKIKQELCSEGCDTLTTTYCTSCLNSPIICKSCFQASHGTKSKACHKLQPLNIRLSQAPIVPVPTCLEHKEPLRLFCFTDQMLCCFLCHHSGRHR